VLLGVSYGLTLPAAQALTVNLSAEQYRPRMLPIAGLLFQVAILSFPLVAGTIVAASDYTTMFWVLLAFALAIAALGMRRSMLGDRRPRAAAALVVGPAAPDG
jgi:hypothetical protein